MILWPRFSECFRCCLFFLCHRCLRSDRMWRCPFQLLILNASFTYDKEISRRTTYNPNVGLRKYITSFYVISVTKPIFVKIPSNSSPQSVYMPGICHSPRWAPCLLCTSAMLPLKYLPDIHLKRLLKSLFPFPPNNSYLLLLVMVLNHNPMKPRVLVWNLRRHIIGEK